MNQRRTPHAEEHKPPIPVQPSRDVLGLHHLGCCLISTANARTHGRSNQSAKSAMRSKKSLGHSLSERKRKRAQTTPARESTGQMGDSGAGGVGLAGEPSFTSALTEPSAVLALESLQEGGQAVAEGERATEKVR